MFALLAEANFKKCFSGVSYERYVSTTFHEGESLFILFPQGFVSGITGIVTKPIKGTVNKSV